MQEMYPQKVKAIPHNSRLTAQAPLRRLRHGICVAKMLDKIQYYLRFWLSICRTSLAVSALRIMRYCLKRNYADGKNKEVKLEIAGTVES